MPAGRIAFQRVADAALARSALIVPRWLPGGRREGNEWVAINPTRSDHHKGSFKVNLRNGRWGDFAGDPRARGGDLISLGAYLFGINNREAALRIADMLGVHPYE